MFFRSVVGAEKYSVTQQSRSCLVWVCNWIFKLNIQGVYFLHPLAVELSTALKLTLGNWVLTHSKEHGEYRGKAPDGLRTRPLGFFSLGYFHCKCEMFTLSSITLDRTKNTQIKHIVFRKRHFLSQKKKLFSKKIETDLNFLFSVGSKGRLFNSSTAIHAKLE